MKSKFLLLISLLTLLTSSCVPYINPIETNPLGKTYQGSVNFRNMVLPLPEGEWKVVGRGYSNDDNYVELCLWKAIGNKPHSVIFIKRDSLSNSFSGYVSSNDLKRENIHHVVSNSNQRGEAQDGWLINHIRISFNKKSTQANKESYQYIIDNKLVMPGNFIQTYHHFTGANIKKKFLTYSIHVNPEVEGFAPPIDSEWASSDWNPLKINSDPKKVAYIEKLKEEGAVFHQKLKEAFGK